MARGERTGRGAAGATRPQNTISVRAGRGGWGRMRAGLLGYMLESEEVVMTAALRPADRLVGLTLPNGWQVIEKIARPPDSTGGHFSVGYVVTHPEKPNGFLKAIDYSLAMSQADPAAALVALGRAFLFERDLCLACARKSLDHVVVAIDHGTVIVDSSSPLGTVQFIVFELANGDIRSHLNDLNAIDLPFVLRALHHVAVGVRQLHVADSAHQDLKPSNVLQFVDQSKSKVADLGRAWTKGGGSPFDQLTIAGDRGYAPPELLYGYVPAELNERRFGCDLYLFGSLIYFMFTKCTMTGELLSRVPPQFHPAVWKGKYEDVLPHLQDALSRTLEDVGSVFPEGPREELLTMVRQLCEPDPAVRGHPQEKRPAGNRQSLDRYISRLDALAIQSRRATEGRGY